CMGGPLWPPLFVNPTRQQGAATEGRPYMPTFFGTQVTQAPGRTPLPSRDHLPTSLSEERVRPELRNVFRAARGFQHPSVPCPGSAAVLASSWQPSDPRPEELAQQVRALP